MAVFGTFFKQRSPKQFEYKPRFYDPELEERREKLKKYRESQGKDDIDKNSSDYVPGKLIRGSMSSRFERKKPKPATSLIRLAIFAALIIFVIYFLSTKDFSEIFSIFFKQ